LLLDKFNFKHYESMFLRTSRTPIVWIIANVWEYAPTIPKFAALIGERIAHLNLSSLMVGIFWSALPTTFAYSVAGASIGCSIVDSGLGLATSSYRSMIILSCALLAVVSTLPSIGRKF
jgi:hypothetical protein